jgi:hypothetical protein
MELCNHTPFAPFTFEAADHDDDPFQVVVVRGTFDIVPDEPLRPAATQDPVKLAPVFRGDPLASSLLHDDDLAPYKERADILVEGNAYAPGARPHTEWLAGLKVGELSKRVMVTGPRVWTYHALGGWMLSRAAPTTVVPLCYENAFGGSATAGDRDVICEHNPVGRGVVDKASVDRSQPIVAPSVMASDDFEPTLDGSHSVEGFGPIAKHWLPRRRHAGTFDDAWVEKRSPQLPLDFSPLFHNCAHPDLIYPRHLEGDEAVRLERLHPEREILSFVLPSLQVFVVVTDGAGFRYASRARLDTLGLEPAANKAALVWRATMLLLEDGIRQIDIVAAPIHSALRALDKGRS